MAENKQALAYFSFSYYKSNANKLRAVKIINPKGNPVAPGIQNVQNEQYAHCLDPYFFMSMISSCEPTKHSGDS